MEGKLKIVIGTLLTAGWVSILFYGSTLWNMLLG
jgi:hypothetical protein